jgi:hypothetical protein
VEALWDKIDAATLDNVYLEGEASSISVVAGARNHLQANRSLGFCFEILI